jgi:hypothetical protein
MKSKLAAVLILILAVSVGTVVWINKTYRSQGNEQQTPIDTGDDVKHFPADGQRVGKDVGNVSITFPFSVESMEIGAELNGNPLKTGRPIISEDRRTVNLPLGNQAKAGEYKVSYLGCEDSQRVFCREGEFKFTVE